MDKTKILIVEDDVITSKNICDRLELLGYDVSARVYSGVEAVDIVDHIEIDLIIMDIMLPGKYDGIKTAEIIHTKHDIPIIYLTAYTDEETLKRAKITEPFGYLIKPFEVKELQSAIQIALYKHNIAKQLKESEEKYRNLIENINDVIFTTDQNGILTYISKPIKHVAGYEPSDIIGRPFSEFVHYEDIPHVQDKFKRVLSGNLAPSEYRIVTKTGEIKWIQSSSRPIFSGLCLIGLQGRFSDITERKQIEQSLKESERKFRLVTETIQDVFWISTPGVTEMIYISPGYEKIWRKNRESLYKSPRSFLDSLHPEDLEEYLRIVETFHAKGKSYECEYRIIWGDGSVRWILERGYPIIDLQGDVTLMTGICTDITGRKKTDEALRDSEERFRKVFEEGAIGMVLTSHDLKFFSANPAFCEMLGYTQEEMNSKTFLDVTHPDHREVDRVAVEKMWCGEILHYSTEKRYIKKDGNICWGSLSASLIKGKDGTPLYALAMIEDITNRKEAEEALRESERRLSLALEGGNIGLWDHDFRTGRVIRSKEWAEMLGYKPEEITDSITVWKNVIHPDDYQSVLEMAEKHMKGEIPEFKVLHRLKCKDGSYKWILDWGKISERDKNGIPIRSTGIHIDLTDRMRIEEALRQSEERYRKLVELTPSGILIHVDGKIVLVNSAAAHILGPVQPIDLIGKRVIDFVHPEYQDIVKERVRGITEEQRKVPMIEERLVRLDGKVIDAEVTAIPFKYEGKNAVQVVFTDITERKKAEEAIKESESRLKSMVSSIDEIVFEFDESGRYLNVWAEDESLLAKPMHEILGFKLEEVLGYETGKMFRNIIQRVISTNKPETFEYPLNVVSGRKWFSARVNPIASVHDKTKRVSLIARDITERKLAEETVIYERNLLQTLLDHTPDHIYFKDRDSRFIRICKSLSENFGLSDPSHAKGKTDFDYFTKEHARLAYENEQRIIKTGSPMINFEEKETWPDGKVTWVSSTKVPLRDNNGQIIGTFGISRDITENKKAEEALHESERRLSLALEGAKIGLWDQDFKTGQIFRSKEWNEMLGYDSGEIEDNSNAWKNLIHPDDLPSVLESTEKHEKDLVPEYKVMHRLKCQDNSYKWILNWGKISERDKDGNPLRATGIHIDLTDRVEAEEKLRRSEERYNNFISQSFEGIYRMEMDKPINTSLPVEEQIDLIYDNAYIAECNQALARMYGIDSYKELIGKRLVDFHGGKYHSVNREAFKKYILAGYKTINEETYETTPDGEKIWFLNNSVAIIENGFLVRIWGTQFDITDKKLTENALKESEQKYRTIFEESPIAIEYYDGKGNMVDQNKAALEMFGIKSQEDFQKFNFFASPQVADEVKEKARKGEKHRYEKWIYFDEVRNDKLYGTYKQGRMYVDTCSVPIKTDENKPPVAYLVQIQDMTEQKIAEENLKQSEYELKESQRIARLGRWHLDHVNNQLTWSDEIYNLFGFSRKEFDGNYEAFLNAVHPEDRIYVDKAFTDSLKKKIPYDITHRILRPNGEVLHAREICETVYDKHGKAIKSIGTVQDITEIKKAENALRESAQRQELVLKSLPVVFYSVKADKIMANTWISSQVKEITGYSYKDFINDNSFWSNRIHPEDKKKVLKEYRSVLKKGAVELEYRWMCADGEYRWFVDRTKVILDEKSKLDYIVGLWVDINERKKIEKELEYQKIWYEQLFRNITSAVVTIDKNDRITSINDSFTKIFGYKINDIKGEKLTNLIVPHSLRDEGINLLKIPFTGKVARKETVRKRKDGSIVDVDITGVPIIISGDIVGLFGMYEDISERKRAEEEIKRSHEQLRKLSLYLQDVREDERKNISYEIHDDLGQKLTALKIDTTWIKNQIPKENKKIISKTKSICGLIDETIQTVQEITSKLRPGILDDLGLVPAIGWQLGEFERRTGIKCRLKFASENIPIEKEKSVTIFRIIQEALTNIARHSKASRVSVNIKGKKNDLEISIRDNGKGITKAQINDPNSFGIMGIRERINALNGSFMINGLKNKGTEMRLNISLNLKKE